MSQIEVHIRKIIDDDFGKLTELIKELGYPSSIKNVSERLSRINSSKCYNTLVAEVDRKVVGFIGLCKLYAYEFDGEYVRIIALVVNEQYRGKGIGTKLLESAEKWAIDEGATAITLNSGIDRKKHKSFIRKMVTILKDIVFQKLKLKQ